MEEILIIPKVESRSVAVTRAWRVQRAARRYARSSMTKPSAEADAARVTVPVAVVADELALARCGVVALLESIGVEVTSEAHSARDVLDVVAADAIDLVVLGSIVDGDAVDLVARCKQCVHAPKVVVLLGPRDRSDAAAYLAAGADGVVSRNAPSDEISKHFRAVLAGEQLVSAALAAELAGQLDVIDLTDAADDYQLSVREREMLMFLAQGLSNREIATALSLSLATVKSHLVHLYAKLHVNSRAEALGAAVTLRLLA